MDTLDLLQEVLNDYAGTVLLVSHDRDFIDRVVTSVIYMPGDGTVYEHAGSYSDLLAKLSARTAVAPVKKQPKPETARPPLPAAPARTVRLSYNQQRLLEVFPPKLNSWKKQFPKSANPFPIPIYMPPTRTPSTVCRLGFRNFKNKKTVKKLNGSSCKCSKKAWIALKPFAASDVKTD